MSHGKNTRNNSPWTHSATLSSMSSGVCRQINAITRVKSAANKSSSNVIPPPPDSQSVESAPMSRGGGGGEVILPTVDVDRGECLPMDLS